jgi:ABC-type sugar transport system ATPase subunit
VHQGATILVMDEPMAALGLQEQSRVIDLVSRLADRGLTQLIVSHNLDHVFRLSTRVAVMRLGRLSCVLDTADTDRSEVLHLISGIESTSKSSS